MLYPHLVAYPLHPRYKSRTQRSKLCNKLSCNSRLLLHRRVVVVAVMSRSGAGCVVALLMAVVLVAALPRAAGLITCPQVYGDLTPCINFLRNGGAVPPSCCSGIRNLNAQARDRPNRRKACACLKTAAAGLSGLKLTFATQLPGKCGVSIPYKISGSTDCTKLKLD